LAKALCKGHKIALRKAGTTIVRQGDARNEMVFILAGRVLIVRNNRVIAERAAGECVGELAVIDAKEPRAASIVAKEECVVATVSEPHFTKVAKKFPELWRALAKQNAQRLRERLLGVRPRNEIPKVFVGSSRESLAVAKAVQTSLQSVATVIPWSKGVFGPDKFILEALEDEAKRVDFAVMVFGPDDKVFSRHKKFDGPRDNVIFELGLFMGALGRKRAFVIAPGNRKLKIPSDLLGTNFLQYRASRTTTLATSVDTACEGFREIIRNQGPM
jgi:CRP/FNR family transcriptional regulator, cyclic AMP receptor protein